MDLIVVTTDGQAKPPARPRAFTENFGDNNHNLGDRITPQRDIMLLDGLFGNETAEKVLLYLAVNDEAYAQELSDKLGIALSTVQSQLRRLERRSVLVSQTKGRLRLYSFNPRFPLTRDVRAMLLRSIEFLPDAERAAFAPVRRRPRAAGKPL